MPALHRVFLVGPMGAGKTTIGKYLAQHLKLRFADTDSEIEVRTGADIQDPDGASGWHLAVVALCQEIRQIMDVIGPAGNGRAEVALGSNPVSCK